MAAISATSATSISWSRFSNIVDGKCSGTKRTLQGVNPSTLEDLAPVPLSESADVDRAVAAAKQAAPQWARTPLTERQEAVLRFADAIEAGADHFAEMLVREQGKPIAAAASELQEAVKYLRGIAHVPFSAEQVIEDIDERRVVTRYVPFDVSVAIIPWNLPVLIFTFKAAPALVAGSPLIVKPSPFTPYSALKLVELAQHFFPPGVLQALSGDDSLGPLLTAHPGVAKVSFTGSTATGRKVMESCARTLKRVTLELGGNDPAIICAGVDVASVAQKVCVGVKRVYVHSSIYRDFIEALAKAAKSMPVGDGFDKNSFLGPVQNASQYERVQEFIQTVREGNLQLALGSAEKPSSQSKGYFVSPIIVDNPPDDSKIVQEEPFGPIFPVLQWDLEEDVIQRANNTDMGLGASVWSRDAEQADRLSTQLEAGIVWINSHLIIQPHAPFGGHKSSGIGSEGGVDGIKAYCNTQTIYNYK
ncbi:hypothetical protein LCI18_006548 [Fusarium solani-melongenae]|uniref:Uncharacterized protein n=1 Tax=Fusarium solani subsp. cucurbitae TaxID=2747967 RepID=A0ACD3Z694_FUSSC|nr:hypothetical protein LCI18_006548 [Fusarium solani-melongenae]